MSATEAEKADYVRIGTVRADERIDHETTYLRQRARFSVNSEHFINNANGVYFFLKGDDFRLEPIDINRAIHSEEYVRISVSSGHVQSSELVTTPSTAFNRYSYYPNGHLKNESGYKREGSEEKEFSIDSDEKTGEPKVK